MSSDSKEEHQEQLTEVVEEESGPDYKVGKKVAIDELLQMDQEDESLKKYKEALLGQASKEVFSPKDDPRRVVIEQMKVTCENRPSGDIIYTLETPEALAKMKETPFILREGCNYKITVVFRVQHEIVSGLKYCNVVTRKGIKVAKQETMIGSFAPQKEPYTVVFPRNGWEEAPQGMLARGSYKAKSQFVDDDKQCHLEYEYCFEIKKDWN